MYKNRFNEVILRMSASGLIDKMLRDVNYDAKTRATGKQQAIGLMKRKSRAEPEERALTVADTEGMFIFLAIGFIIGLSALISEWVGGCTNKVLVILKKRKDDKTEADKVERDRIEHEENPSRRVSIFSRRSGGNRTPHSAASLSSLNQQTLKELYEGPDKGNSTMCLYENTFIMEDNLIEAHRKIHEQDEDVESTSSKFSEKGKEIITTKAEINKDDADSHRETVERVFGEPVFH